MSRYNATETDAIDRDNRAMHAADVPMSAELEEIFDAIKNAAIGITAVATDIDSLALGGGSFTPDADLIAGLTFAWKASRFHNGLTNVDVSAGTLVLNAGSTNYVEVDRAGTVSSNTSGFTSGSIPLWTITTDGSGQLVRTSKKPLITLIGLAGVVTSMLSTVAKTKEVGQQLGTVSATASFNVIVPNCAGSVARVRFATKTAIAASDVNYFDFGVVNKGPAGGGATAVVDRTAAANSTKATGGSAVTGYVRRDLTLHGTPANLVVAAGDVLEFTVTKTGAPSNMEQCAAVFEFEPSTL